jgi:hypothetical protein
MADSFIGGAEENKRQVTDKLFTGRCKFKMLIQYLFF